MPYKIFNDVRKQETKAEDFFLTMWCVRKAARETNPDSSI